MFDAHVGLFGVAALVQHDFVGQFGLLAGGDCGRVFDGAIVAALSRQAAAKNCVAVERAADFQVYRSGPARINRQTRKAGAIRSILL